jgi:flagellar hook assembly protein FlgD
LAISTPAIPGDYNLHSVYPNPFNPVTTIAYEVPNTTQVTIKIYDISGREAAQLVNSEMAQGYHTVDWNATNYASGAYFVKMVAGSFVQTRKMVLLK